MKTHSRDRQIQLTQGNILTTLLLFAFPMIAGNLLQQVYNIAAVNLDFLTFFCLIDYNKRQRLDI